MKIHELLTEKCWDGYEEAVEYGLVTIGDYTTTHFSRVEEQQKNILIPRMEHTLYRI